MQNQISIKTIYEKHDQDHVFLNRFIWGVAPEGRQPSIRGKVRSLAESLREPGKLIYLKASCEECSEQSEAKESYSNQTVWVFEGQQSLSVYHYTPRSEIIELADFHSAFDGYIEALTEYNFANQTTRDEAISRNNRVRFIADRLRCLVAGIEQYVRPVFNAGPGFAEFRFLTQDEVGDDLYITATVGAGGVFYLTMRNA